MQHSERARLARRRATLAVIAAAGLAASASLVWAAEKPVTHTVVMKATSYAPIALTIRRGDSVVWINQGPVSPHRDIGGGLRLEEHRRRRVVEVQASPSGRVRLHLHLSSEHERNAQSGVIPFAS
jgi:hypothetical protein